MWLKDPFARGIWERRAIHVNDGCADGREDLCKVTEGCGVAVEVVDEDAGEVALLRICRVLEGVRNELLAVADVQLPTGVDVSRALDALSSVILLECIEVTSEASTAPLFGIGAEEGVGRGGGARDWENDGLGLRCLGLNPVP
jgi:hypothetical protein